MRFVMEFEEDLILRMKEDPRRREEAQREHFYAMRKRQVPGRRDPYDYLLRDQPSVFLSPQMIPSHPYICSFPEADKKVHSNRGKLELLAWSTKTDSEKQELFCFHFPDRRFPCLLHCLLVKFAY
ncbi:hypothetical protein OPV22_024546 [Ensete ventricosum]|uniref:Uncharacterized protein n=1 Tax=Ensete ventricosum TaxID=4639 RepID=A0AAV8QA25_ENSVE|nr:hypothetical protein OPV22_024546 [Ensete ventricosum]